MHKLTDEILKLQKENAILKTQLSTAEKQFFEVIDKTNTHFTKLFNHLNEFIIIFKPNGEIRFANDAIKLQLGYSEEKYIDNSFLNFIHPDFRSNIFRGVLNIVHSYKSVVKINTALIDKSGRTVFVKGTLICVLQNNQVIEYRCILFDITERRRAESAERMFFKIANISNREESIENICKAAFAEMKQLLGINNFAAYVNSKKDEIEEITVCSEKNNFLSLNKEISRYARDNSVRLLRKEEIEKICKNLQIADDERIPETWAFSTIGKQDDFLCIWSYDSNVIFVKRDIELLHFITNQVAYALERFKREDMIRNQAEKLKSIFDSSSHMIWSVNEKLALTSFNKVFKKNFKALVGFTPEHNVINKGVPTRESHLSVEEAEYLQSLGKLWSEKYADAFKGNSVNFKNFHHISEKKSLWFDCFINPIRDKNNEIVELSIIAHDITEARVREMALIKREELFRTIFDSFQDVFIRCDTDGSINLVSPSVTTLLGLEGKAMIGNHLSSYFDLGEEFILLKNLPVGYKAKNIEMNLRINRKRIEFLVNLSVIENSLNEVGIYIVASDVTELKTSNRRLRRAKEVAEKSLQMKKQFLANMSHEIRTPMNGISGTIDLLFNSNSDDEHKEYLGILKESSENLSHIVNDILNLSKIEAGKVKIKLEIVVLAEVIKKVFNVFSSTAEKRQIKFHLEYDEKMPSTISSDETKIIQIIYNMISNAVKFSKEKGDIKICISLLEKKIKNCLIKIEVIDNGIGISLSDQKRIFQSFEQVDSKLNKKFIGTGLGLAISKENVKLLNGKIGVISTPNKGSNFWFTFKANEITNKTVKSKKDETIFSFQSLNTTPLILIVDDNSINLKVSKSILDKAGCEVSTASNGYEAIRLVKEKSFDLIFMDIQMPNLDGIETTNRIKDLQLDNLAPIVALTAFSMEEDKEKLIKAGLDDYLPKPIKAENIIDKVKKWLRIDVGIRQKQKPDGSEKVFSAKMLPVINYYKLNELKKYGGDKIVVSSLEIFKKEAKQQLKKIDKYFNENRVGEIPIELHSLKGTAGTLGIERISKQAEMMEESIKRNKYEYFRENLKKLIHFFEEFIEEEKQKNYI